jgi:pimeloyl-ACP methyl ester carboxylesterase
VTEAYRRGVRSSTVDVDGTRLLLREWGDANGPPLLCWIALGSTSNALYFTELADALAAGYGLRVLSFDPPGFGGSPARAGQEYEPQVLADLTSGLLTACGLRRTSLLGFSWGGLVAAHFAAASPDRTNALVLLDGGYIDPADRADLDVDLPLDQRVAEAGERLARERYSSWDAFLSAERESMARWSPAIEAAARFAAVERDGVVTPAVPAEVFGAAVHGIATTPIAPLLGRLRDAAVPVLLLAADEPPETAALRERSLQRFRSALPEAEVTQLPGPHNLLDVLGADVIAGVAGDWLTSVDADERT